MLPDPLEVRKLRQEPRRRRRTASVTPSGRVRVAGDNGTWLRCSSRGRRGPWQRALRVYCTRRSARQLTRAAERERRPHMQAIVEGRARSSAESEVSRERAWLSKFA